MSLQEKQKQKTTTTTTKKKNKKKIQNTLEAVVTEAKRLTL